MTILGTRPEIIRLSEVIKCCDQYFDQILVHTGQNYDDALNQVFFREMGLRPPDYCLEAAEADLGKMLGNIISGSYALMARLRPDAVLVLGDTNSALSVIGAKRLHIPIFHMEAGNRCFDERLPEEVNRRIADVTADVNLCYSEHARRNLLKAGLPEAYTFVVGSPMTEVLRRNFDNIASSDILHRLNLEKGRYIVLSAHREENVDDRDVFAGLMDAMNRTAEVYDMPILYSCHPRSRKRLQDYSIVLDPRIICHGPLGFFDYGNLQMNAFAVVSDSGTLPEEASFYLNAGRPFPAVCIRTSTERPEAMEQGIFVLAGVTGEQIISAIDAAIKMQQNGHHGSAVLGYMDENVSAKVVRLIQSYTGVINSAVWHKTPR